MSACIFSQKFPLQREAVTGRVARIWTRSSGSREAIYLQRGNTAFCLGWALARVVWPENISLICLGSFQHQYKSSLQIILFFTCFNESFQSILQIVFWWNCVIWEVCTNTPILKIKLLKHIDVITIWNKRVVEL